MRRLNTPCCWHSSEDLHLESLSEPLVNGERERGGVKKRENAFIIVSLAAATHVLLIPNRSHSCVPAVAFTEVLWLLLLNGHRIAALFK